MRSFVGQYLPILDFPKDVGEALEHGEVNLFEAHQLARLIARKLGGTDVEARSLRKGLLEAHLLAQGSGTQLRQRVKEALGEFREPDPTETEAVAVSKADELLEADPLDASHLFFEELRMISRALREIGPEEVTDEDLAEAHAGCRSNYAHPAEDSEAEGTGAGEEADYLAGPPLPAI